MNIIKGTFLSFQISAPGINIHVRRKQIIDIYLYIYNKLYEIREIITKTICYTKKQLSFNLAILPAP
jgi:hypothetical protein